MTAKRPWTALTAAVAAAAALACAAAVAAVAALAFAPSQRSPTVSVHLTGSAVDYQEVNVEVRLVQVSGADGRWITVGIPNAQVNLVRLTGGVAALLADDEALPPGEYRRLRLVLGGAGSVRLRDGSVHPLELPEGLRPGVDLDLELQAAPGSRQDVVVDLDVARSVRRSGPAAAERFELRPVGRALDQLATGGRGGAHGGEG